MIGFFPEPYPDELVYSWLARYYAHSGYIGYSYVAEDLFVHKWNRPNPEFIPALAAQAYQAVTRHRTMEDVVMKHTMFSQYGRFLPPERRNRAFDALVQMRENIHDQLLIPMCKNGKKRFLQYCPLCAEDDREQHGETYWHRTHQIRGISICPIHGCYLASSDVLLSQHQAPALISAEEACANQTAFFPCDEKTVSLVRYTADVFSQPVNMASSAGAGQFLHSKLAGTPYVSVRGQQRHMGRLFDDFRDLYNGCKACNIQARWQLEKVFTGHNCSFLSVCLVAFFLRIPADELTELTLPEISQQEKFDARVHELRRQGMSYPQIARQMNCSANVVKPIGEGRYGSIRGNKNRKGGRKGRDIHQEDTELLPEVQKTVESIRNTGKSRPKQVTIFAVQKLLGLPCKKLQRLPQCMEAIRQYQEPQGQFWAREVAWAAEEVLNRGDRWCWTSIRKLTNMRRKDFVTCFPHLPKYANEVTVEKLRILLPESASEGL